jgi:hypothetical protein
MGVKNHLLCRRRRQHEIGYTLAKQGKSGYSRVIFTVLDAAEPFG